MQGESDRNGPGRPPAGGSARGLVLLSLLLLPQLAAALPTISIEPSVATAGVDDLFDLRIAVDAEADTFSNFDVVVRFDPGRIELIEAIEGSLYVHSGYSTWFEFEEESTGVWEVFDVIFPAGSFLVAPGELARIRLRALADGCSPIEFLSASLKDIDRLPIEPLETEDGLVRIGSYSAVPDGESAQEIGGLGAPYPSPSRGPVRFAWFPSPGEPFGLPVIAVYDPAGRLVCEATPVSSGEPFWFSWDGRGREGEQVPPGVYLIRSVGSSSASVRRVVIVR